MYSSFYASIHSPPPSPAYVLNYPLSIYFTLHSLQLPQHVFILLCIHPFIFYFRHSVVDGPGVCPSGLVQFTLDMSSVFHKVAPKSNHSHSLFSGSSMWRSGRLRGTLRTNSWSWDVFCILNLYLATCCSLAVTVRFQSSPSAHNSRLSVALSPPAPPPRDKQRYFWSPTSMRGEKNNVSWLRRVAADGPTVPDSWVRAFLTDTPSLLTRGTAATLAKCIPWAASPNPCLTLADKPCYG